MPTPQGSLDQVARQVASLQKQLHVTRLSVLACLIGLIGVGYWNHTATVRAGEKDTDGILHVRGLVVEDAKGIERVRLGAPLPDPLMLDGKRHPRKGVISGILISDSTGTERGGYVTADASDEAFLSLDSQHNQEVLFLANKEGGTNLDLFDKSGNEAQLTVFPSGPKFVMRKSKMIVEQFPAASNILQGGK
jgi:hypothetical protein